MIWRDLRHAARVLWRARGFTTLAVVVLALGIGATAAIFSLFDRTLLRNLPYRDAHLLTMLWEAPPGRDAQSRGAAQLRGLERAEPVPSRGDGGQSPAAARR